MIGILVITHGQLGSQLLETARMIGLDSETCVLAVSVDPQVSPDALRGRIATAIKEINSGPGVLILTDMFGGTPCNISCAFLEEGKVEVVTGLNLPMITEAINHRAQCDLGKLAERVTEAGKDSIFNAAKILSQRRSKTNCAGKKPGRA